MTKHLLWALLTAVLLSSNVKAEPTPTVMWLMNEPVSIFEWGLNKMKKRLDSLEISAETGVLSRRVHYNWDDNTITIATIVYPGIENVTKNACEEEWWTIAEAFGTTKDIESDEYVYKGVFRTTYEAFFSHQDYTNKERPDNMVENLIDIMMVSVVYFTPALQLHECKGKLTTKELYYSGFE